MRKLYLPPCGSAMAYTRFAAEPHTRPQGHCLTPLRCGALRGETRLGQSVRRKKGKAGANEYGQRDRIKITAPTERSDYRITTGISDRRRAGGRFGRRRGPCATVQRSADGPNCGEWVVDRIDAPHHGSKNPSASSLHRTCHLRTVRERERRLRGEVSLGQRPASLRQLEVVLGWLVCATGRRPERCNRALRRRRTGRSRPRHPRTRARARWSCH